MPDLHYTVGQANTQGSWYKCTSMQTLVLQQTTVIQDFAVTTIVHERHMASG